MYLQGDVTYIPTINMLNISSQVRIYAKEEHPFEVGQFFSDEPGYYQPGEFGIRLETVLRVVERKGLPYQSKEDYGTFLGFEPVCLVPFENNLIDFGLFNQAQLDWLNDYNAIIRDKVGKELKAQGKDRYDKIKIHICVCQ